MRVILIEPARSDPTVFDLARIPRLGLPLLGQMLALRGHDVRIYVETLSPVDWSEVAKADLVGFSAITATANVTYEMAARVRTLKIPTVIGGTHATFLRDEVLEHCDFVVRGEGQVTFPELVDAISNGKGFESIAGLSYHSPEGAPIHNPDRPPSSPREFAALPSPNLKLIVGHERMTQIPIMTSWGCPYDCDFCSVVSMFGRNVRYRPVADVLDELEQYRGKNCFFYDDNFVVNEARTTELLQGMIDRKLDIRWIAQMRTAAAYHGGQVDHDLLTLMNRSGCKGVFCGIESVRQATLDAFNKRQKVEDIAGAIRAFHGYKIHVHGMFVFGADTDDTETFRETVDFALEHKIDTLQFMMLVPLPGTRLYSRMEEQGRLLTKDWSLYDGHYCVIRPKLMSPYELQVRTHRAMLRFYSASRSILLLLKCMPLFFYREMMVWLQLFALPFCRNRRDRVIRMLDRFRRPTKQIKEAFRLPAMRLYARNQLRKWADQAHSQKYLRRLLGAKV